MVRQSALIYAVHDLSRGNVASDPLCATPCVPRHILPLPLFFSSIILRRAPLLFFLSRFVLRGRVFGRVALFDLRPFATSSARLERRRKGGNEKKGVRRVEESELLFSRRLFPVTFDGRLVTRLNLRRIEYIAPTIYLPTPIIRDDVGGSGLLARGEEEEKGN